MPDPLFSPTPEHDEGAPRAEDRLSSPTRRGPLRPATAAPDEPEGLSLAARFEAGAGTPIVDQHPRRWLPRRAIRGWFFADLLRLPRIARQRHAQAVTQSPGTGRGRRASAVRTAPGIASGPASSGAGA